MPIAPKPNTRRWKWIALTTVAVVICSGLASLAIRPTNGIWVEQLEAELNRELPDGSTEEEAEAWFTSRGFFHHSGISFGPADTRKQYRGRIGAIVPNDSLLEYAEIHIEVMFDAQGRVCRRLIYRYVQSL